MAGLSRRIAAIALAAILPATIAACGGGSSHSVDPQQVLRETFSNPKSISSGKLGVDLSVDVHGSQGGNFSGAISGPFQSGGKGSLPQFNLTGRLSGSASGLPGLSIDGGLAFTADNAYVEYQGTAYRLPHPWFARLESLVSRAAQAPSSQQGISSVFKSLGINPADWFTNLSDEGTTDVDGVETDHISGDVDVGRVATDLRKLSQLSQQIPGQTARLTPRSLALLKQEVRAAHVDVYSGTSDHLLRKLAVSLDLAPPGAAASGSGFSDVGIDFSITLSDLNKAQTISTPPNAQPLPQSFLRSLQSALAGGLPGAALGGGASSSGSGGSGIPPGFSRAAAKCVENAGNNAAAINKCLQKFAG